MTVSVFWDLYCAAPERHDTCEHSSEAKAFHDYGFVNSGYGVNGISHNSNKWGTLIYNTLIEHYLQIWYKLSDTMNRLQYEQKIMRLLESPDSNCDKHHALILCQAVNFRAGLLYLYEENKIPVTFQGSRCKACNNQLELPSVHFLCQHSFHQQCRIVIYMKHSIVSLKEQKMVFLWLLIILGVAFSINSLLLMMQH
ncbi:uncharacterized protein LOC142322373 isoform X1 [Lycorma delicatula]|uniref:uncharacterized protein LOC142322373 isoform X1 n=1 Tax=Lycorma delicatula TaxID=130591 RepID=UPI003F51258B